VNANNGGGNATIYSVGGSYDLSKRTLLDVEVATVRNTKVGTFSLKAKLPGNADNPLAGHSQSCVYAGIQAGFNAPG
jgi:predicted porin